MKIALIGPYPPPYGGISVHIQRMAAHLEAEGIECVIYDDSGTEKSEKNVICINNLKSWLPKYFFFAKEDVIHYHSPNWILRIIFGLMGFWGKKTIISIHGESLSDSLKSAGWFRKKIIIFALKHTSFIIADNQNIEKLVLSVGVSPSKVEVIPAFIPPVIKEESYNNIPEYVWDFISSHKPIISANAANISFYEGVDLYGLDMCVELVYALKKNYPDIGLVFCLPVIGNLEYFKKLKQRMEHKGILNNILFITEPLPEVYPIWRESDIFVRATCTDGDALSIREAMYFKIPVVTSDIVPRPEGVVLFKNRDAQDFIEKTKDVLDNLKLYKSKLNNLKTERGFDKIIGIYKNLGDLK